MTENEPVREIAPAKINLTLHVTGQRPDGYHLLDSLVVFADFGDRLEIRRAEQSSLRVSGPRAQGVPADAGNLAVRAAALMDWPVHIDLQKHLPSAAGIGGGSADAAAVLRGIHRLSGRPLPNDSHRLGADVPVCLTSRAARMQGLGEDVIPLPALPALHAVLVNPGVEVPTPRVFAHLTRKENPAMPRTLPVWTTADNLAAWLAAMRNDLEQPAIRLAPVIAEVLTTLKADPECVLARMSGSGATCFALTDTRAAAEAMTRRLARPGWWVQPVTLS
ncbi:Putative 4-diphosphocytidyl-2C-methyl-D-erythritol kinase [Pseudooceanicola batsensis HTCC2597]|uniref:4-diphosphocytidyl-2-C-methyl-D-erythritol kinase n=1 Tax=Pseudooceanicola batsensis (strain ATCC BAA-863 / DSM 15984 / KCTC 12145 / HTCC2597) TaxID=252305 RepID=A3TVB0_PSEBH|nr:4-(cytidine 5'-diphospho)-2-C-methyl-D-erythritol kinase [Pseudooceanicola batsensis]EAQ04456.1 Putative 4-diphosphocytidyl-2C-methyl-D-erythritol kinase [Pseudooceanicola batsensis HTCC2597]